MILFCKVGGGGSQPLCSLAKENEQQDQPLRKSTVELYNTHLEQKSF